MFGKRKPVLSLSKGAGAAFTTLHPLRPHLQIRHLHCRNPHPLARSMRPEPWQGASYAGARHLLTTSVRSLSAHLRNNQLKKAAPPRARGSARARIIDRLLVRCVRPIAERRSASATRPMSRDTLCVAAKYMPHCSNQIVADVFSHHPSIWMTDYENAPSATPAWQHL